MALSFKSVEIAYKVFHQLGVKNIHSWPDDMANWSKEEMQNPKTDTVYGYCRKADDGWENLVFFVRDPSDELIEKWQELNNLVPNSSICKPYSENPDLFIIGWF